MPTIITLPLTIDHDRCNKKVLKYAKTENLWLNKNVWVFCIYNQPKYCPTTLTSVVQHPF